MLKRISIRKLSISCFTLLVLLLMYIFPNNIKDLDVDSTVSYETINSDNLSQIFLVDNNEYIAMTNIVVDSSKDICSKARELVSALIIDGEKQDIIPNGFKPIIPAGTTIDDIYFDNGAIKIYFSKELLEVNEKYEEKMIEAICYTLTSIEGVNNVLIYVDGEMLTKLPNSGKYLPEILNRDYGINKQVDISSYKDVVSINVYYTKVFNDNYYYVPVTKYVNSSEDKVKIIIDELSSAPTYEENLMSFLNSNVELINYNLDNSVLSLEFNDYLIEDISTMSMNDKVKDAISYSMRDNFNINEVIFTVGEKEISKSVFKTVE